LEGAGQRNTEKHGRKLLEKGGQNQCSVPVESTKKTRENCINLYFRYFYWMESKYKKRTTLHLFKGFWPPKCFRKLLRDWPQDLWNIV